MADQLQKLTSTNQQQPSTGLQQPLPTKQPAKPTRPTLQAGQPERLTLNDFITESQKLGQLRTQKAAQPIIEQYTKEAVPQLQRQLYGSGLGTGSGVGQQLTQRSLEGLSKELASSAERVGLETAQQELGYRKEQADKLMNLVQSGQITGPQAEVVLRQQGIEPESFMTPEQVQAKQRETQFQTVLQQTIKDPDVAMLIDNEQELEFYMQNGKTYEDEVADIISKAKTFEEWNAKRPVLQQSLASYERKLNDLNAWLFKDPLKIASTERKIAALSAALEMLDAGQAPTSEDIASLERV